MPSLDDETESSRPLEVKGELNRSTFNTKNIVGTQDGGNFLSESTLLRGVDGGLVVFQTDPELGRAEA